MGVETTEMQVATCDGCGKTEHWPTFEPPVGLHIQWTQVDGTGGFGGKLFTCISERCAAKALKRRHEIEQEKEEEARR